MSKIIYLICLFIFPMISFAQKKHLRANKFVTVQFENIANGKKIVLNDSTYTNVFGEKYTVSKLKYYVTGLQFVSGWQQAKIYAVALIDLRKKNAVTIKLPQGKIKGLAFMLGVDSALNCSGAQSGALDALNDMFWTWNNGYVMFKLEGTSPASAADLNRIEHHIGGYKGDNKTMRDIFIPLKNKSFSAGDTLTVQMDMDKYWRGKNENRIAEKPMITTVGPAAKRSADNFPGMFFIKN